MKGSDVRRRQLAAIHLAKRDLSMDEDSYRLMLHNVAGVDSARDLTADGRRSVLDHLRRIGWEKSPHKRTAQYPGTPHNIDSEKMLQKIGALLADMGLPWSYADAISRQQTGIERVVWVRNQKQLSGVIGALHVEQEKRDLLATVEALLKHAGIDREHAAERFSLRQNWSRHRATLLDLAEQLKRLNIS